MAKSQEQRWAEGYYGALVGLTVRKVEVVVNDDMGYPELWPTITMVADDGEEFVVEVSRDQEGNGAGFLFGLPAFTVGSDRPSPKHNRSSYVMPFENVADEIERRTGQYPYLDMTGGGLLTVGMSLAEGHFPTVDYEMEKMPWVHLANYGLDDDGEVLFEDFYRPTFGVFLSGDGSYCGDIYNTDGLDYKSERYRMLDEWHDRISSLVEVDDDEKTSMSADEFVDHVVKVWEMWKRERRNVPEGVVTGLEVTA